jgi:hypothetical protein
VAVIGTIGSRDYRLPLSYLSGAFQMNESQNPAASDYISSALERSNAQPSTPAAAVERITVEALLEEISESLHYPEESAADPEAMAAHDQLEREFFAEVERIRNAPSHVEIRKETEDRYLIRQGLLWSVWNVKANFRVSAHETEDLAKRAWAYYDRREREYQIATLEGAGADEEKPRNPDI